MEKIIQRKKVALENLYKIINNLSTNTQEISKVNNNNILDKKIEILKNNIPIYFNEEIDNIVYKYIVKSGNSNISSLIELAFLYNEEKERDKLIDVLDKIIEEHLKNSICNYNSDKLVDLFNKVSINKTTLFKIINKVVNNGIIQEFKSYIVNNREFLYIFDRCKNSLEIINRIIDVLIVNQEIGLQLGYKELFRTMNNHLENIQNNQLDIEIYVDILLLELLYEEDCSNISHLYIIDYDNSQEKELIDLIKSGINNLCFDENRIFKLSNYRQRYLITKIIERTLNSHIKFNCEDKKDNYNNEDKNNDYPIIEKVYELNNKDKFCKLCSEGYSESKVWLAYYTDLNQKKYNGVILATLYKCKKCNTYYADSSYIKALEMDLEGDVIKFIKYKDQI